MSYTPTNWQTGDTVTAEKLNNMESGIVAAADPFVVTLTPTAQNYSGVMDKTVAEINEAYEAGKKIVFKLVTGVNEYMDIFLNSVGKGTQTYPSFNALICIYDGTSDLFVNAFTGSTNDGTKATYITRIYPLTPMS